MAEKAFLQILEAETQAQATIRKALEEAARMIKRAEEEAAEMLLDISNKCKEQAEETKRQIESAAQAGSARFAQETGELCDTLQKSLSARKRDATEVVIRSIIE